VVGIPGTGSNHGNSHLTAGILNQKQRSVKLISDAPKRETGRQKHIESSSLIRTEETLVGAVRIESATPQSKSRKRNGSAPPPLLNWSLWGPNYFNLRAARDVATYGQDHMRCIQVGRSARQSVFEVRWDLFSRFFQQAIGNAKVRAGSVLRCR